MQNTYRSAADLMATRIQLSTPLHTMLDAVAKAGETAVQNFGKSPEELGVVLKGDQSILTLTDTAIQDFLIDRFTNTLGKRFVDFAVLAEEERKEAPQANPRYVMIVDPLDGTRNFKSGNPTFAIAAELTTNNQGLLKGNLTVVLQPMLDLYTVATPAGSFQIDRANQTIEKLSAKADTNNKIISLIGDSKRDEEDKQVVAEIIQRLKDQGFQVERIGSCVLSTAGVATKKFRGSVIYSGVGNYAHPWDIASVDLITRSGGIVTTISGEPDPLNNDPHSMIGAYDEETHTTLLETVRAAREAVGAIPLPDRRLLKSQPQLCTADSVG